MSKTILMLAAAPDGEQLLDLDKEVRNVREALKLSRDRDSFRLEHRVAVRWKDMCREMEELKPSIVHFLGHGDGKKGLLFEEEDGTAHLISADSLKRLFEQFKQVECVVLNACYSAVQAKAIHEHVPCVIGMSLSIGDRAARDFAEGFYDGLGSGQGYRDAFKVGLVRIANDVEVWTPELLWREPVRAGVELEPPGSRMPIESRFYVERPRAEEDACREVMRPGALIRIKAPCEFGKSSLMARVVDYAENQNLKAVAINMQEVERDSLGSLDSFLRYFCVRVTRKLKVENQVKDDWESGLGSKGNCGEYFEDYLLPQISGALVLELDEVDLLFDEQRMRQRDMLDFFGMLRAWYERGKTHRQWQKLRLILVHSKDVSQETIQQSQSPFNVGTEIELPEFSESQIVDLAERHGQGREIAIGLMSLVGGHPQLVRLGLYQLARQELSLEELLRDGATEAGLYGKHLQHCRSSLERDAGVMTTFRRVLASDAGIPIEPRHGAVLRSLGLVKLHRNDVQVTCELYRQYFRGIWS
jgi:hypothetical protein